MIGPGVERAGVGRAQAGTAPRLGTTTPCARKFASRAVWRPDWGGLSDGSVNVVLTRVAKCVFPVRRAA